VELLHAGQRSDEGDRLDRWAGSSNARLAISIASLVARAAASSPDLLLFWRAGFHSTIALGLRWRAASGDGLKREPDKLLSMLFRFRKRGRAAKNWGLSAKPFTHHPQAPDHVRDMRAGRDRR